MTRGSIHDDTHPAARQLSEPSEFWFASSPSLPSSSSSESRWRNSTASPARPELPSAPAQDPSTPPQFDLDWTVCAEEVATRVKASEDPTLRQNQTVLEQAIERHTATDPTLGAPPELIRWHSYGSSTLAGERREEDHGMSSGDSLDGAVSTTAAPARYRRLVAPPTPLALPGGWTGASASSRYTGSNQQDAAEIGGEAPTLRWRTIRDLKGGTGRRRVSADATDSERDEALVLPPPFLTTDSPRESFDGEQVHRSNPELGLMREPNRSTRRAGRPKKKPNRSPARATLCARSSSAPAFPSERRQSRRKGRALTRTASWLR